MRLFLVLSADDDDDDTAAATETVSCVKFKIENNMIQVIILLDLSSSYAFST